MPDTKKVTDQDAMRTDKEEANQQKTASDFDQTVRDAEKETRTAKPGESQGGNSKQHNNGRGGGK